MNHIDFYQDWFDSRNFVADLKCLRFQTYIRTFLSKLNHNFINFPFVGS
jgi:hypothetical protein